MRSLRKRYRYSKKRKYSSSKINKKKNRNRKRSIKRKNKKIKGGAEAKKAVDIKSIIDQYNKFANPTELEKLNIELARVNSLLSKEGSIEREKLNKYNILCKYLKELLKMAYLTPEDEQKFARIKEIPYKIKKSTAVQKLLREIKQRWSVYQNQIKIARTKNENSLFLSITNTLECPRRGELGESTNNNKFCDDSTIEPIILDYYTLTFKKPTSDSPSAQLIIRLNDNSPMGIQDLLNDIDDMLWILFKENIIELYISEPQDNTYTEEKNIQFLGLELEIEHLLNEITLILFGESLDIDTKNTIKNIQAIINLGKFELEKLREHNKALTPKITQQRQDIEKELSEVRVLRGLNGGATWQNVVSTAAVTGGHGLMKFLEWCFRGSGFLGGWGFGIFSKIGLFLGGATVAALPTSVALGLGGTSVVLHFVLGIVLAAVACVGSLCEGVGDNWSAMSSSGEGALKLISKGWNTKKGIFNFFSESLGGRLFRAGRSLATSSIV